MRWGGGCSVYINNKWGCQSVAMGNKVQARTMRGRVSVYRRFVYFCLPLCYCCSRCVCSRWWGEALNKNPSLTKTSIERAKQLFVFKLCSVLVCHTVEKTRRWMNFSLKTIIMPFKSHYLIISLEFSCLLRLEIRNKSPLERVGTIIIQDDISIRYSAAFGPQPERCN